MPVTLPAGFTIDTQLSPDRVRVQWPATATPGTSTLPNLGFESGDTSYIKGDGWAISAGGLVEAGTQSAKFTGIGQSNIVHETLAPVTAGTTITASARISKGNNRQDFAGGAVVLQWFDNTLASLGFNVGNVVNTGTSAFQSSSVTANAPTGAAYVRLAASATRDVKGRATDAVTVDTLAWNHTFTLGGTGGGSTAPTGPQTFTFRVRDANGCEAVATRTIGGIVTTGQWVFFGREASGGQNNFIVQANTPTAINLSTKTMIGLSQDVGSVLCFDGVIVGKTSSGFIRATNPAGPYTFPAYVEAPGSVTPIARVGSRLVTPSIQYSDDFGESWTAVTQSIIPSVVALAANASGNLVAFRNVFTTPLVSFDDGASWSNGGPISETTAGGIYDVVGNSNKFLLVYLNSSSQVKCTRGNSNASSWEAPINLPFTAPSSTEGFVMTDGEDGVMVVTGTGLASYSEDFGTTWSSVTSVGFNIVRSLTYGDGAFVVTGEASGGDLAAVAYTIDNGATWSRANVSNALTTDRLISAVFIPN